MTGYEILRQVGEPFLPVLHSRVRRLAHRLASDPERPVTEILDVGGRSSPYTVGLPARVTIVDRPRESDLQRQLHLGVDRSVSERLARRRSNIGDLVIEDFTRSSLPSEGFDLVLAVEVLEHVLEDERFVAEVARVLRPGGSFLMTTPNGDYIRNEGEDHNPDHVRHYTRRELSELLASAFARSRVWYDVRTGKNRYRGLRSVSARRPAKAATTLVSNLLSHWESRGLEEQPRRTAHLFGLATKAPRGRHG